jgi:valyl-tRNA synthetase
VTSARAALALSFDVFLRLFAPVVPFATEEVWSWWRSGSIHRAAWPSADPLRAAAGDADPGLIRLAGEALAALRKVKSQAKVSQRTEVIRAELGVSAATADRIEAAYADLRAAGRVRELVLVPDDVEAPEVRSAELATGA